MKGTGSATRAEPGQEPSPVSRCFLYRQVLKFPTGWIKAGLPGPVAHSEYVGMGLATGPVRAHTDLFHFAHGVPTADMPAGLSPLQP